MHSDVGKQRLSWLCLRPYCLDLLTSDFHLFGWVKEALKEKTFTSDVYAKATVIQWLYAQPKTIFADGIKILCKKNRPYKSDQKIDALQILNTFCLQNLCNFPKPKIYLRSQDYL